MTTGGSVVRAVAPADDVAGGVGVDVGQPAVTEAARDPAAALVLFARRRGDLRDGDLRAHDRVVVRGEPRVRRRERTVRVSACRRGAGARIGHAYHLATGGASGRKW